MVINAINANQGSVLELSGGFTLTDKLITNAGSTGLYGATPSFFGNTPFGTGGLRDLNGSSTLQSSFTNQAGSLYTSTAFNAIGVDVGNSLTVNGVLNFGNGLSLAKVGGGTLVLAGATSNTAAGANNLELNEGTVQLNKPGVNVNALPAGITPFIGDGRGTASLQIGPNAGANQLATTDNVFVESSGKLDLTTGTKSQSIQQLLLDRGAASSADVELGNAALTITGDLTNFVSAGSTALSPASLINGGSLGSLVLSATRNFFVNKGAGGVDMIVAADITGNGAGLTKAAPGAGTLVLSGTNTYSGATTVNDGILEVDGALGFGSAVTVNAGGILTGHGTVFGTVNATPTSATVALPGIITSGTAVTGATGILTTGAPSSTAVAAGVLPTVTMFAVNEPAASNTVTVTAPGTYTVGEVVTIAGVTPATFNGTFTLTGGGTGTFTYTDATAGIGAATVLGTITPIMSAASEVGNVVTITAPGTYLVGELVTIAGVVPAGYNGTYMVATVGGGTFTYLDPNTGLTAATTNGTVGAVANLAPMVAITINGTTPGTGYDQIDVNGGIILTNSVLSVTMPNSFTPPSGSSYVIINNVHPNDLTTGNFIGLPEGSTITVNGFQFKITYVGGDGNDVVLNYVANTAASVVTTETATNPPSSIAAPGTAVPGSTITYTVLVSNTGSNPVSINVADVLPTGITTDSYGVTTSAGVTGASGGVGNINQTINLPVGGTATYVIVGNIASNAIALIGGTMMSDTATISYTVGVTPTSNSSTSTVTLTPESDLAVTNTASVASDTAGNPVTYTIVASNSGPSDATNATVVDNFPTGGAFGNMTYSYTATYAGGASDATLGATTGTGNINDTVNLPSGGSITYTVVANVPVNATATSVSDTVTINSPAGNTDANTTNNTATATYSLLGPPDLQITNTVGQTSYPAGSPQRRPILPSLTPSW